MKRDDVRPLCHVKRTTRCTFYDSMLLPIVAAAVFSYRERLDPARLRASLERVLSDYSEYAGRAFRRDGSVYIEHGIGTSFEVVESRDSSTSLGVAALRDPKRACPPLSVAGTLLGRERLFAARLTQTPDGSVLGMTINHAVGDMHSTLLLLRAWAQAYREAPHEKPLEVPDRDAYLNQHLPRATAPGTHWNVVPWPEFFRVLRYWSTLPGRRVCVDFSAGDLAALQSSVRREQFISANDALVAHLFLTICRVLDAGPNVRVAIPLEYRKRFGLPSNLIGNLLDLVTARADAGDDTAALAVKVREAVNGLSKGPIVHRDMYAFQTSRPGFWRRTRYWNDCSAPGLTPLLISNYSGAKLYELAFGTLKPTVADIRVWGSGRGASIVVERPEGAGLTADLWLPARISDRIAFEHRRSMDAVLRDNDAWSARCSGSGPM